MKVPKNIAEKIEQRNKLTEEICSWFSSHEDLDGFDLDNCEIVSKPCGQKQHGDEYCDQYQWGEDSFSGNYFYQIEGSNKFVKIPFWI